MIDDKITQNDIFNIVGGNKYFETLVENYVLGISKEELKKAKLVKADDIDCGDGYILESFNMVFDRGYYFDLIDPLEKEHLEEFISLLN